MSPRRWHDHCMLVTKDGGKAGRRGEMKEGGGEEQAVAAAAEEEEEEEEGMAVAEQCTVHLE